MIKNIFSFKTFRKNIVFVCLGIVLYTVMDFINHISASMIQMAEMDFLILLLFVLLGMITDTVKNTNKQYKETKSAGFLVERILLIIAFVALIFMDICAMTFLNRFSGH